MKKIFDFYKKNKKKNLLIISIISICVFIIFLYLLSPYFIREALNISLTVIPVLAAIGGLTSRYLESNKATDDSSDFTPESQLNKSNYIKESGIESEPDIESESEKEKREIQQLYFQLIKSKTRINTEINRLIKNSNLNLIIALLLTGIAIIILSFYAYSGNIDNYEKMFTTFLPKLSIAVFIEIFSFFFLKMYKSNSDEIKYFQNEITNIEQKIVAIKIALFKNEQDLNFVITELLKIERNFILRSGDSTVEIEKAKIDYVRKSEMLGILNIFKGINKKE